MVLKFKTTPDVPYNESGRTQMIMMGKSIRQIWVNKRLRLKVSSLMEREKCIEIKSFDGLLM